MPGRPDWLTTSEPTHELLVRVPLNLANAHNFDIDPVKKSLQIVMAVSRVRLDQLVCGDPIVELRRLWSHDGP